MRTKFTCLLLIAASCALPSLACSVDGDKDRKQTQPSFHHKVIEGAIKNAIEEEKKVSDAETRSQKVSKLVYSRILPVVKATTGNTQLQLPAANYSRCPSGYRHVLALNESAKTPDAPEYNLAYGKIVYRNGCAKAEEICDFKIDLTTSTVWLKDNNAKEYVTMDAWASLHKKITGDART